MTTPRLTNNRARKIINAVRKQRGLPLIPPHLSYIELANVLRPLRDERTGAPIARIDTRKEAVAFVRTLARALDPFA